ncbi:acyl-CoA N-acyltransferase [Zychaea mexicana]|uniref:acyl-CoA N-acyltransferase n=1 Tax=Zychaea mexicana TaxID=64656 RepID=UPI0022FE2731|nr:acyl-CoA N-acyltransferase [Zychaea mexicana]KAI9489390.1 acyl-CoA N-acyltransferase [Zychaea mexicana]
MSNPLERYNIRKATEEDLPAITEIYNERIANSTGLFIYEPVTIEYMKKWLANSRELGYPAIVAVEKTTGQTIAYAYLGTFRSKPAYNLSAEITVYIHLDHHRQGLGRLLSLEMLRIARDLKFKTIIAGITSENTPSIGLFKSLGFGDAGTFHNCGYKFGRFLDVTFLEYYIPETEGPGEHGGIPTFVPFPWDTYTFGQSS